MKSRQLECSCVWCVGGAKARRKTVCQRNAEKAAMCDNHSVTEVKEFGARSRSGVAVRWSLSMIRSVNWRRCAVLDAWSVGSFLYSETVERLCAERM